MRLQWQVAHHVLDKNTFHGDLIGAGMAILRIAIPAAGEPFPLE
jgi:hypothetical protein